MAGQEEAPAMGASNRRAQTPRECIACRRGRRRRRFHPSRDLVHRGVPVRLGGNRGHEIDGACHRSHHRGGLSLMIAACLS